MFADFFTPEVTGLAIIMLFLFHFHLLKILRVITEGIGELEQKIYSLELTCDELKSPINNLTD